MGTWPYQKWIKSRNKSKCKCPHYEARRPNNYSWEKVQEGQEKVEKYQNLKREIGCGDYGKLKRFRLSLEELGITIMEQQGSWEKHLKSPERNQKVALTCFPKIIIHNHYDNNNDNENRDNNGNDTSNNNNNNDETAKRLMLTRTLITSNHYHHY